jgi:Flp pilus assembly secretin CpaC
LGEGGGGEASNVPGDDLQALHDARGDLLLEARVLGLGVLAEDDHVDARVPGGDAGQALDGHDVGVEVCAKKKKKNEKTVNEPSATGQSGEETIMKEARRTEGLAENKVVVLKVLAVLVVGLELTCVHT